MALATLAGNVYLVLGSAVMGVAAAIASWFPGRDWAGVQARLWARGLLRSSGVRLELSYAGGSHRVWRESIGDRPVVYMANHRSLYDIAALLAILDLPVRFLAKRSLFRLPFFGWGLRAAGFVPVDREDRSRAAETFAAATELLASGVSLVVFPE
ncbi:MAG: 1-acyl-sn-glycerol-3-phosphate acyltransferase, partial [Holophagales bacterium]|nr:1-acyl-sn-glycerol-3-phosphate acyltransferase [Holophagales bacterium]